MEVIFKYFRLNLFFYLGGEALTVVDTLEAWVFHIIPDPTGTSAVWVAQRVPDGKLDYVGVFFTPILLRTSPNVSYHCDFLL